MPPDEGAFDQSSHFDIVAVLDPESGDTGARHASAAIRALANSGYQVGVLFWMGCGGADAGGIEPQTKSLLDHPRISRLSIAARASARMLIAFDLRLFLDPAVQPVSVNALERIAIVTRRFADTPTMARMVLNNAREALGGALRLAPVAASMRLTLETLAPDAAIMTEDWPPVFAPDPSGGGRARFRRAGAPTIGYFRHGRHRPWPSEFETFKSWLPQHHLLAYHLLHSPESWTAELRDAYAPLSLHLNGPGHLEVFLDGCDFVVTTDAPEDDPYPEELIRALDAGVIPLLTPYWQKNFYYAAAYAPPSEMAGAAIDTFTNDALADDIRAAWHEMRDIYFAPDVFISKIRKELAPEFATPLVSGRTARPRRTVLSLSTNGIGMGHLTRQLAIARRLPSHITPVFLSFSHAANVVRDFGYMVEFQPFHNQPRLNSGYWNLTMHAYLESVCRFYRPSAFVLDANIPFDAIDYLRENHPELPFIWVRRGMWGDGRDLPALEKATLFDVVIEPDEIAGVYDTGPTAGAPARLVKVPPLMLLDGAETLPRSEAAKELGLDPKALNVLVLPGAQNNFDLSGVWRKLFEEFVRVPGLNAVFAEWAITDQKFDLPTFVQRVKGYPFSRWFAAFDFAVSAAGYNSFAELISARLPTIFVPNENPTMDRQDLRALFAERHGMGLRLCAGEEHRAARAVQIMCNAERRRAFREVMERVPRTGGAVPAADIVTMYAEAGRASPDVIR